MNITIYIDHIIYQDGIFTWMCNFHQLLSKHYDITILTKLIEPTNKDILERKGIHVETWNKDIQYITDYLLIMLDFVVYPSNFAYKKKFKIIHCNYAASKSEFVDLNDGSEFIAVSKQAAEGFTSKYNLPCKDISSFVPSYTPRKVLRLISCSRIYENKGFERMFKLADDLDEYNVPYQWINYSEIDRNGIRYLQSKKKNTLITFLPAVKHEKLLDLIADSDYLVQLSDKEGYCYAVHESLMLGTPVIVTDIDAFKDIVQDGENGYKLPLDMQYSTEFLVEIIKNIPKFEKISDNLDEIKEKWLEVLSDEHCDN